MRDYGKVSPRFWTGETGKKIRKYGRDTQVLALYLMTSPHANMLGLYYLPITFICHETGLTFEGASKGLQRLFEGGFCAYDEESEHVFVYEMAKYQIGESLKASDNRVAGIRKEYESLPKNPFLHGFFEKYGAAFHLESPRGSEAPSKPLRSQEQEQEQEQEEKSTVGQPPLFDSDATQPTEPKPRTPKQQAEDILAFLNEKAGRSYRPTDANLDMIVARLKEGASVEDCLGVITRKCRDWKQNPDMDQYLRPATLFNRTKFNQYVGETGMAAAPRRGGHSQADDDIFRNAI